MLPLYTIFTPGLVPLLHAYASFYLPNLAPVETTVKLNGGGKYVVVRCHWVIGGDLDRPETKSTTKLATKRCWLHVALGYSRRTSHRLHPLSGLRGNGEMSKIARELAKKGTDTVSSKSIQVLPFSSFNIEKFGTLSAAHHFSFGKYYDPKRVRHGLLRVFDDGIIGSTQGIPFHPHRNIDIISVVLHSNYHPYTKKIEGGAGIVHTDTGGSTDTIRPGNAQVMSLGHKGLAHSEAITEEPDGASGNAFQIWINQTRKKNDNLYTKVTLADLQKSRNKFVTLASGFDEDLKSNDANVGKLQSDSRILSAVLTPGNTLEYTFAPNRLGYLVPASGNILINDTEVKAHDAAQISDTEHLQVSVLGNDPCELVLIDTHPDK